MSWLLAHWGEILAAAGAVLGAASIITRMTPTPKDDQALARVRRVLGRLSMLQPPQSARRFKMPLVPPTETPPHPDDQEPPR